MIPTKTYPLSAIMGGEISDKERIAELADAFNRVCAENADFVAESIKADRRIAELEAELTMRREQAEGLQNQWVKDTQKIVKLEAQVKHCEGHAAELEAEVRALRWKAVREGK
jgi:chromosome segregation ATPase